MAVLQREFVRFEICNTMPWSVCISQCMCVFVYILCVCLHVCSCPIHLCVCSVCSFCEYQCMYVFDSVSIIICLQKCVVFVCVYLLGAQG